MIARSRQDRFASSAARSEAIASPSAPAAMRDSPYLELLRARSHGSVATWLAAMSDGEAVSVPPVEEEGRVSRDE